MGRASKKKQQQLIVDDHEVPSSLYAVVSNDDLLSEILLRLPAYPILVSKSVSKGWLSLITGPVSTTLRCSQNPKVEPPSGLFLLRYMSRVNYDYVPFDIRFLVNRSSPLNITFRFGFPRKGDVEILQSCNGLQYIEIMPFIGCILEIYNNALHWMHTGNIHFKLDAKHLLLTTIQTPDHDVLDKMCGCKLFESRGCLLLVGEYTNHTDHTRHLNIYEMSKGCSGWSILKNRVNLDDINMKLKPISGRLQQYAINMSCYRVLCIVLGEKEEDSFLVMERGGKVEQYMIVLETIHELYDFGPTHFESTSHYRCCYQLYASFTSV